MDDETTIILQYPQAQCVIQASWNWPFSRKDMAVYGTKGYANAVDASTVQARLQESDAERSEKLDPRAAPYDDPFSLLAAVVKGSITLKENDLYGLSVNTTTIEILEAAIKSAQQNETIFLSNSNP